MPTTSPIRGPGVFLAQFAGDAAPYNSLDGLAGWAAGHGYAGVQIPTWDTRLIDLALAADSQTYCDDLCSRLADHGLQITELSTHSPSKAVTMPAPMSTSTSGSLSCARKRCQAAGPGCWVGRLGPWRARRAAASASLRP